MLNKYGYVRVASGVPKLEVSDCEYNSIEIVRMIKEAYDKGVQIINFPELCITGYTCGDLFNNDNLLDSALDGLERVVLGTKDLEIISIVGMPLEVDSQLFNVGVVIYKGGILGIVPKVSIPNYSEFYEKRWFSGGKNLISNKIKLFGREVLIGNDLLFRNVLDKYNVFGIEICEDLWIPNAPSVRLCQNGANVIFNLSASNEIVGKYEYRRDLVRMASAKNVCGYVYTSAGCNESSSDLVFSGHSIISENGNILLENKRFDLDSNMIVMDIDVKRMVNDRRVNKSYIDRDMLGNYRVVDFELMDRDIDIIREYSKYPFVPFNNDKRVSRCKEIITIQAMGLAKRLKHINTQKTVIGISGGLDSTLAFLVIMEAYKILGIDNKNIIAITMPGFGTTNRTYNNACELVRRSGATLREIGIKDSCIQHFKDIGHDMNKHDVTYENVQARERTQILMDVANKEGGIVIGTGDLSELVLGWCTYNGDHMSMYAVNVSIPKTLVRYLVEYVGGINDNIKDIIKDILDTPVSPELLPPSKNDKILQVTEDNIGPYMLHDYFIYHFLRCGEDIEKIYYLAKRTFKDEYSDEEIKKWLLVFLKRFFSQQFKRNCLPDGPKVGSISVSPRGDLRMPSDGSVCEWVKKLERNI